MTEGVQLAISGTVTKVDRPESFAALDPLVGEINRLISKSYQEVRPSSGEVASEASFLQVILQQVLLLEERAVMAVDKDNQFIAASASLAEVIPVNVGALRAVEDRLEEIVAPAFELRFDAFCARAITGPVEAQIFLEVPAQVPCIVLREGQLKVEVFRYAAIRFHPASGVPVSITTGFNNDSAFMEFWHAGFPILEW